MPPPMGGKSENATEVVINCFHWISHHMGMTNVQDTTAEVVNALMRQFLLALAQCEIEAKEAMGRKNPIWTEKCNFQSFLNVPNQVSVLGPI